MKLIFLIPVALSLLLLCSCVQDNYEKLIDSEGLLKRVEDDKGETIAEYTYRSNGTLKTSQEFSIYYMTGKHSEFDYTFDDNGLLQEKNGFEPGNMVMSSMTGAMDKYVTCKYEYDLENRISSIKTSYHYEELSDIDFETNFQFEYPDKETVRSTFNYIREEANSGKTYNEYKFNNKGNIEELIVSYSFNNSERVSYKEEYTYDDQNTPYDFNPGPKSANNVLSKNMTAYNYDENGNQSIAYTSSYSYEYTYYRNGYPKSVTETWPNEQVNTKYYYYK